jgi:hypothetical protein
MAVAVLVRSQTRFAEKRRVNKVHILDKDHIDSYSRENDGYKRTAERSGHGSGAGGAREHGP